MTLFIRCVRMGLPLIERLLQSVEGGARIPKRPQDLAERRVFGARPPNDGRLSWFETARRIAEFVRASDYRPFTSPWGHPTTARAGRSIGIVEGSPTRRSSSAPPGTVAVGRDRSVLVATADYWLAVQRVQHDGRYRDAIDVLRADDVLR
jgi:methionyl-tRNA formyltransferase